MKRFLSFDIRRTSLFIFLATIFSFSTGLFLFARFLHYPNPQTTVVYFEKGSSLRKISQTLAQNKIVSSSFLFEWWARLEHKGAKLKAGEYQFDQGFTSNEVLNKMVIGLVIKYPLTIPEGYNLKNIGKLLSDKNLISFDKWMELTRDPAILESLGITAPTLEGFLFPDTYDYEKGMTVMEIVGQMVKVFHEKVTPSLIAQAKEMGLSLDQWVTLASIVEKETAAPDERPLIASVFLNRLRIDMPLQTDPSVIYGINSFNGNLTHGDLLRDTPYNTYTRKGLPPGPICAPGLASLKAVLEASQAEYLYFVSKGNGHHVFSKTLEEHNKAVTTYQLHLAAPPKEP